MTLRQPNDARVSALKAKLAAVLKRQGQRVADRIATRIKKFAKAAEKKPTTVVHHMLIDQALSQGWNDLPSQIAPLFDEASGDTAVEVVASAGLIPTEEQWDHIDEATTQLARDRAAELVGMRYNADGDLEQNPNARWAITDDVRDELTNLVAQAEEEEWSSDRLKKAITEADLFSDDRAETIARTELKRIDAMSADATAKATGATSKRWLLSADHDEVDECDDNAQADWVDLDDDFPSGADLPPEHPRCQCVVTFGWEETDEESGDEE